MYLQKWDRKSWTVGPNISRNEKVNFSKKEDVENSLSPPLLVIIQFLPILLLGPGNVEPIKTAYCRQTAATRAQCSQSF